MKPIFYVYILKCDNGAYYTGYTNNLEKRYQAHLDGRASKYTNSFKPKKIAQSWIIEGSKSLAMKVEAYIKKLPRKAKEELILNPISLKNILLFK